MKTLNLPNPPRVEQYPGNPTAWMRATTDWMERSRGALLEAVNSANRPCGQQFATPTSYTLNTVATGTMTGTDIANVVCSLVYTLENGGILSPTISRSQSQ